MRTGRNNHLGRLKRTDADVLVSDLCLSFKRKRKYANKKSTRDKGGKGERLCLRKTRGMQGQQRVG